MTIPFLTSLVNLVANLTEIRWGKFKNFGEYWAGWFGGAGTYEAINYDVELELLDSSGSHAIYRKHQEIRFLQNNVMAYSDKAWGDGDIFANYKCSPGVAVDRYKDGYRYRILISFREVKHRNEKETIQIERHIRDGFTHEVEELQTDIDHRVRHLSISAIFPEDRYPTNLYIFEQNSEKGYELGTKHRSILPDKRMKVSWSMKSPRLYSSYVLRWTW